MPQINPSSFRGRLLAQRTFTEAGALEQALTAARYFLSSTRGGILACFWAEIIFSWYLP